MKRGSLCTFESPVPTDPKANICGKSEIEKVKIKIILFPL